MSNFLDVAKSLKARNRMESEPRPFKLSRIVDASNADRVQVAGYVGSISLDGACSFEDEEVSLFVSLSSGIDGDAQSDRESLVYAQGGGICFFEVFEKGVGKDPCRATNLIFTNPVGKGDVAFLESVVARVGAPYRNARGAVQQTATILYTDRAKSVTTSEEALRAAGEVLDADDAWGRSAFALRGTSTDGDSMAVFFAAPGKNSRAANSNPMDLFQMSPDVQVHGQNIRLSGREALECVDIMHSAEWEIVPAESLQVETPRFDIATAFVTEPGQHGFMGSHIWCVRRQDGPASVVYAHPVPGTNPVNLADVVTSCTDPMRIRAVNISLREHEGPYDGLGGAGVDSNPGLRDVEMDSLEDHQTEATNRRKVLRQFHESFQANVNSEDRKHPDESHVSKGNSEARQDDSRETVAYEKETPDFSVRGEAAADFAGDVTTFPESTAPNSSVPEVDYGGEHQDETQNAVHHEFDYDGFVDWLVQETGTKATSAGTRARRARSIAKSGLDIARAINDPDGLLADIADKEGLTDREPDPNDSEDVRVEKAKRRKVLRQFETTIEKYGEYMRACGYGDKAAAVEQAEDADIYREESDNDLDSSLSALAADLGETPSPSTKGIDTAAKSKNSTTSSSEVDVDNSSVSEDPNTEFLDVSDLDNVDPDEIEELGAVPGMSR